MTEECEAAPVALLAPRFTLRPQSSSLLPPPYGEKTVTKPDAPLVERYAPARAYLDELPPDSPLLAGRDMGEWLGQIAAYQHSTCQRCGAALLADVLGPAAYAAAPFARVCGECYAELLPHDSRWRRHARLTAFAAER